MWVLEIKCYQEKYGRQSDSMWWYHREDSEANRLFPGENVLPSCILNRHLSAKPSHCMAFNTDWEILAISFLVLLGDKLDTEVVIEPTARNPEDFARRLGPSGQHRHAGKSRERSQGCNYIGWTGDKRWKDRQPATFRPQIAEANGGGRSYKGTAVRQWLIKQHQQHLHVVPNDKILRKWTLPRT